MEDPVNDGYNGLPEKETEAPASSGVSKCANRVKKYIDYWCHWWCWHGCTKSMRPIHSHDASSPKLTLLAACFEADSRFIPMVTI